MLKIFIGYDPRQACSYTVLQHSIIARASVPVSIIPLIKGTLPVDREGLTPFTWSRFLVPWLCNYEGLALFLDADMLCQADIKELFDIAKWESDKAAWVVQNEKRFEWASLIMFNCAKCHVLTPEYIETASGLHGMKFIEPDQLGAFPAEWNHLVGYDEPIEKPKLIHFTQGVPRFPETRNCLFADRWFVDFNAAGDAGTWVDIMGTSVHAVKVNRVETIPRLMIGEEQLRQAGRR